MSDKPLPVLANVLDLLLDAVCVVDRDGRFVFTSAAVERIFGYAPAEMIGRRMIELVHPDDRERTLQAAEEINHGRPKPYFRNRYVRKDGSVVDIMWSARWSEADQLRIAVARDVSELSRAEAVQAALYAISEAAHAAGDLLSLFRRIHAIIAGLLPPGGFLVALCNDDTSLPDVPYSAGLRSPSTVLAAERRAAETIAAAQPLPAMAEPVDGRIEAPCDWLGVPLRAQTGVIGALVVQSHSGNACYARHDHELLQFVSVQIATAIERKRSELRLQHLALHDPLTDLPNRALFRDRLRLALNRARRQQVGMGLLYIDLDGFKQVNDRHGHAVGDQLLCAAVQRLQQCVRESDTVGRVGGDEFMVVLDGLGEAGHAALVAEKIRDALEQPFMLAGQRLHVSASIGIAIHPEHGQDGEALVRHADESMYRAKADGGNRFCLALTPHADTRVQSASTPTAA